jgi:hypothetical protein
MRELLERQELMNALDALDSDLAHRGIKAKIFIVGGAAMSIAYDARRSTSDVDAVFVPVDEVRAAAARVAEQLGLEPEWLNEGVKGFLPGEDPDRIGVFEGTSVSVTAASPRFLLAMKLLASRVERDQDGTCQVE